MPSAIFNDRRAVQIENSRLRVTVLLEGGHIGEILCKATGISPLWIPPWPSIDPSTYDPAKHPIYGCNAESRLLSGLMGHNVCLDMFGGPSAEEEAAGTTVHGEAPIVPYRVTESSEEIVVSADLHESQLRFERRLRLSGSWIQVTEAVENLSTLDRPVAWTEHVTLGPPFLEKGATQFRAPGTRSKVMEGAFGKADYMQPGAEFDWPFVPTIGGGSSDLRVLSGSEVSGGFTTHLMDQGREKAFFFAWSPGSKTLLGYIWNRSDFPWLGIWEENCSRADTPWCGRTVTRGMEFGVSPFPETRRHMIDRGRMFGVPCYRWIPAKSVVNVKYSAFVTKADVIPESEEALDVV